MLFCGASLQQMGMVYTTAGNAGFITGFYVIFVPIMGMLWGLKTDGGTWIGAVFAVIGMYFLSVTTDFSISFGDALVLASAFFWAGHVHIIGHFTHKIPSIQLASIQFFVCAFYSLIAAFVFETNSIPAILDAVLPILYAGLLSTGVAYTLQVVAQKNAHPAHAAIILSLEAVFALLGGWLLLGEKMSARGLFGGGLMLAGMILSQLHLTLKGVKNVSVENVPE
jgi:drug/metabolite transporter (DMT)-like permease